MANKFDLLAKGSKWLKEEMPFLPENVICGVSYPFSPVYKLFGPSVLNVIMDHECRIKNTFLYIATNPRRRVLKRRHKICVQWNFLLRFWPNYIRLKQEKLRPGSGLSIYKMCVDNAVLMTWCYDYKFHFPAVISLIFVREFFFP